MTRRGSACARPGGPGRTAVSLARPAPMGRAALSGALTTSVSGVSTRVSSVLTLPVLEQLVVRRAGTLQVFGRVDRCRLQPALCAQHLWRGLLPVVLQLQRVSLSRPSVGVQCSNNSSYNYWNSLKNFVKFRKSYYPKAGCSQRCPNIFGTVRRNKIENFVDVSLPFSWQLFSSAGDILSVRMQNKLHSQNRKLINSVILLLTIGNKCLFASVQSAFSEQTRLSL